MTDNIDVVVKESGTTEVVTSFDKVAAAAKRAHTEVKALQKLFGNVGRSTAAAKRVDALGKSAQGASGHIKNLNSAMTSLNNTRVTSNLNSANNALKGTGTAARGAATGVRDLLAAFISLHAIKRVIGSLIEAQVSMQQIHYGLLSAAGSAEAAGEQFEYLRRNANTLGLDLQTSAQEYTRLAASATAMNVAVEDQQKLYTSLSQASTVFHLDAQKVQFATLALTQMFSKGKIQAEELRRQLGEAIPGVVPRFQRGVMEMVKGTELAKYSFEDLMKRGLLDTAKFLPALTQALGEAGQGWKEAAGSMNAEINRLKTAWFELKVQLTEGLFSDVTIAVLRFLSSNLKEMVGVVAALGVTFAAALAPAAIIKFIGYVKMLGTAIWAAAGPWGLIAAAILGVVTYLVSMRNEIKLSSDSLATLGDFVSVIWSDLSALFEGLGRVFTWITENIGNILTTVSPVFAGLSYLFKNYKLSALDAFDDIEKSNDSTWMKILKGVARTIDAIVGLLIGLARAVLNVFAEIGKTIGASLANSVGGIKALLKGDLEGAMAIAQQNQDLVKGTFARLGEAAGAGFDAGFEFVANNGLEQYVKSVQDRANKAARFRNVKGGANTFEPSGGGGGGEDGSGGTKKDKELDKLKAALARLLGQVNPTQAALKKLAEAQEILDKSVKRGLISQERAVEVMGLLREKYKDALDPVGALNDKYDEELRALRAITPEQKAVALSQEVMNEARKKGYDVTVQAALGEAAYRRELEKTQAQLIAQAEAEAYANSAGRKSQDAAAKVQGLVNQAAAGNVGEGQMGVGVSEAFGMDPSGYDQYKMEQEQYAAHLTAMQELRVQYGELAAQTEGEQRNAYLMAESALSDTILQMEVQKWTSKLEFAAGVAGQFTGLMNSQNKQAFKIGQAAAIAQVAISTPKAAMDAYSALAGIPYVGPVLGVAAAAAAVVYGMQQISKIRSQQPPQFRTGGSMVVGGNGGIDSQLVQFQATPGEHISINTPAEARAMQRIADELGNGGRGGNFHQEVTIVQQGRPTNRTAEQQARALRKETQKEYEANYGTN